MIKATVQANRSFRTFDKGRAVSKLELLELIDLARLTPSAVNAQPLKYKLVWEQDICDKLTEVTAWAAALRQLKLPPEGSEPTAYIVVCLDETSRIIPPAHMIDVGIVAQTILLGATEKGLGGCMLRSFKADAVKEVLSLPTTAQPLMLIAIGKPAEHVKIVELGMDGSTSYYRDDNGVHCVPKRSIFELIID